jgi:hypothetical protein
MLCVAMLNVIRQRNLMLSVIILCVIFINVSSTTKFCYAECGHVNRYAYSPCAQC